MKLTRKILASVLALVMVLLMLPAAFAAEDNVHTLDVGADMEAFGADSANAGKEIVIDGYFAVILGENTRVDDNNKTFADDYAGTKRLNFQHKSKLNDNGDVMPAVKFTTSAAATVKLWWYSGGDGRQFHIMNAAGETVVATTDESVKNDPYISELTLDAAGTYYLATPDGSNYLYKMEVTEAAGEAPACEHTGGTATCKDLAVCEKCGESYGELGAHAYAEGKCSVCGAEDPDYVAPEKVTITVGDKSFEVEKSLVAIDQELSDKGSYAFIVYTPNYTGELGYSDGYGQAIVVDQNGVIVRAYDGFSGKYFDAENAGVKDPEKCDAGKYLAQAFASLQEGETLIVAPSTYKATVADSSGKFLYGCRTPGAVVSEAFGLTFGAPACEHANTELKNAVAAGCESEGYTGDTYCADCGEKLAEGEKIAALGHNYVDNKCTVCNNPKTADVFGIALAVLAVSGTALVVLKKKED